MSFEIEDAKRTACPLLIGLVGASFSGKTVSALRLASGIVRVTKKPIVFIDTESRRSTHYADRFQFKAMHFTPPFGALRYLEAIKKAVEYGAGCIIVDSMTHEHSGEGGMLWQSDQLLERYESERDRNANLARSFIKPKRERARLVNGIVQLGATCPIIFCFRAAEKLDFKHKVNNQPRDMGWQPETTSPLMYEMTQQFLLTPGCEGVPILTSSIPDEKRIIKSPSQFQGWFRDGEQLSEDIGERFAKWAFAGQEVPTPAAMGYEAARASLAASTTLAELKAAWTAANRHKASWTDDELSMLEAYKDEKKEALSNGGN
jgi:hypothetical protein